MLKSDIKSVKTKGERMKKKIIIFAIIVFVIVSGTVFLIVMDEVKSRNKQLEGIQKEYLQKLVEMQAMQARTKNKPETIDFDELRKNLPEVDKIDYEPNE